MLSNASTLKDEDQWVIFPFFPNGVSAVSASAMIMRDRRRIWSEKPAPVIPKGSLL